MYLHASNEIDPRVSLDVLPFLVSLWHSKEIVIKDLENPELFDLNSFKDLNNFKQNVNAQAKWYPN